MRRLMLAVAAVLALGASSTCTASALADTPTVGQLQVAIDSNAVTPNFAWNAAATSAAQATAAQEHVVILQAWETDELEAIKAADPNTIVLMYQNTSSASTSASANGMYSTGVSYQQAASNGWLLDNTSGQPFTFSGENWLYATDIGSTGYQNAWASNVISELKSAPWDGVFMDDVNPTIGYHYCVSCVAKYPSDATYSAAMGSFVQNVGTQIQGAGELAIANIGSWSGYGTTVDPWLHYLSGAMDEEFLKWGTSAGSGYASEGTWQTQLGEVALTASENKLFLGVTHSAASDEQAAVYGYATELLAANGNASFSMAADYTTATSFPEYGYQIGDPTGAYTVTSDGVYERAFTNGLALVNPTGSTETVSLGGSYSGSGLSHVTTVTMAPLSGLVLMPDAGTSTSTSGSAGGSGATSGSPGSGATSGSTGSGSASGPPSGTTSTTSTTSTSGTATSGDGNASGSAGPTPPTHVAHSPAWWRARWLEHHREEAHARWLRRRSHAHHHAAR